MFFYCAFCNILSQHFGNLFFNHYPFCCKNIKFVFLSWFAYHHAHKFPFFCLIICFENMNCSEYLRFFTFFSIMFMRFFTFFQLLCISKSTKKEKWSQTTSQMIRQNWRMKIIKLCGCRDIITCALLGISSKLVAQIE